jgi:GntR family transcriptional regulator
MTYDGVEPIKVNRIPLPAKAQEYLLGLIENGTYEAGEQLPSETVLATQLGISRPTLRQALHNLEQEGMIVRMHGVGTFVTANHDRKLESGLERLESILELAGHQGLELRLHNLEIQQAPAEQDIADKLRVPAGTEVTSFRRTILEEGTPVAYMVDVVPSVLLTAEVVDAPFRGSVLDLLRRELDLQLGPAVANIIALNADALLAGKLAVQKGQAVLLIEELLYDEEGTPVEFSQNYFVPDFFRFHVLRR